MGHFGEVFAAKDSGRKGKRVVVKMLIFEKIDYVKCRDLFPDLNNEEVMYYAYELLRAIKYTHSIGVMHRDIKPSDVLIDPKRRKLRLIDWGVAGFYHPREK